MNVVKKTLIALLFAHVFMVWGCSVFLPFCAGAEIGKQAEAFTLPDVNGREHSLADYRGQVVVLEWVNYDCPFVKKFYEPGEMQKLQKEYTQQGVVWLSICSSASGKQGHFDSETIHERMKAAGAQPTAYLIDEDGAVGRAYGAKTTPHMFIIDEGGNLVYAGAIDSIRSTDSADIDKAENYVRQALDALLADPPSPVPSPSTPPYGCSIKY